MKTLHNKLTVDVISSAPALWNDCLEQVCPLGITTSFVVDQTARAGP